MGPAVARNDLLCCDRFDVMDRVYEIPLPTLVICGTEDVMTPVKYAIYLAERIPRSQMVLVEGGTHCVHLEHPGVVNRAISQFLAAL